VLFAAVALATESCTDDEFVIERDSTVYLRANTTSLYGCGDKDLCASLNKGLQTLTVGSGNQISITNGNTVTLPVPTLGTDVSITHLTLTPAGGSSPTSTVAFDPSSTNEIQSITSSLTGNSRTTLGLTADSQTVDVLIPKAIFTLTSMCCPNRKRADGTEEVEEHQLEERIVFIPFCLVGYSFCMGRVLGQYATGVSATTDNNWGIIFSGLTLSATNSVINCNVLSGTDIVTINPFIESSTLLRLKLYSNGAAYTGLLPIHCTIFQI